MKKYVRILCAVAALALAGCCGCTSGSQVTFGPLHAQSQVQWHRELQDPGLYVAELRPAGENGEENLCTGSSYLWWSSEACMAWYDCNEMSADAWVRWNTEEATPEPQDEVTPQGVEMLTVE